MSGPLSVVSHANLSPALVRRPGRYQVNINEIRKSYSTRKLFPGKGGLPRIIWARNNDNTLVAACPVVHIPFHLC